MAVNVIVVNATFFTFIIINVISLLGLIRASKKNIKQHNN